MFFKKQANQRLVVTLCLLAISLIWLQVLFLIITNQLFPAIPQYNIDFLRSDGYLQRAIYFSENGCFLSNRYAPLFSLIQIPITMLPTQYHALGVAVYQTLFLCIIVYIIAKIAYLLSFNRSIIYTTIVAFSINPIVVNWYLTGQSELFQSVLLLLFIFTILMYLKDSKVSSVTISYLILAGLVLTKPVFVFLPIIYIFLNMKKWYIKWLQFIISILFALFALVAMPMLTANHQSGNRTGELANNPGMEILGGTLIIHYMLENMYLGTNFASNPSAPYIADIARSETNRIIEKRNEDQSQLEMSLIWHINHPIEFLKKILINTILFCSIADTQMKSFVLILYNIPIWVLGLLYGTKHAGGKTGIKVVVLIIIMYLCVYILSLGLGRYMLPILPLVSLFASCLIVESSIFKYILQKSMTCSSKVHTFLWHLSESDIPPKS